MKHLAAICRLLSTVALGCALLAPIATATQPRAGELSPAAAAVLGACDADLAPPARDFLIEWADALDLLPLDRLEGVAIDLDRAGRGTVTLRFDFGRATSRKVELPGRRLRVLRSKRGAFDLERGKVRSARVKGRTLAVAAEVRLEVELATGVTGVRDGDLAICVPLLGRYAVDLSTSAGAPALAEHDGSLVLATDVDGDARRTDGQVVPQAYRRWLVIECAGTTARVGLGAAEDGRALL